MPEFYKIIERSFSQSTDLKWIIFLLIVILIYMIRLLSIYSRFIRELELNNRDNAAKFGICIVHSFTYSWIKGVSITVTKLDSSNKEESVIGGGKPESGLPIKKKEET